MTGYLRKQLDTFVTDDFLTEDDLNHAARLFIDGLYSEELSCFAWSSYMIHSFIDELREISLTKTSELFLRALWLKLEDVDSELVDEMFGFCKAVGNKVLISENANMDLRWCVYPVNFSQACLTFWLMGASSVDSNDEQWVRVEHMIRAKGIDV